MHGRPPFATPVRRFVSKFPYMCTHQRCPLIFRPLPLFARACVSFLSFFLACFSIFLLHCRRGTLPALLLLFSFIVHLHPPLRSLLSQFSFSLFLSIYLFRSSLTSSCALSLSISLSLAFSQSLRTYARQSMCARLNRAGAVEMAGSRR